MVINELRDYFEGYSLTHAHCARRCKKYFWFFKKTLQNLYPFWFYVVLNTAFLKETKVHMENTIILGWLFFFFLKKEQILRLLSKIYNITTSSAIPHFKDESL